MITDTTLTLDLLLNATVLAALTFVLGQIRRLSRWPGSARELVEGVLFGGGAWLAMRIPFDLAEGLIVDGRSVIISLAGAFGGPIPAAVAVGIASAVRIGIGGVGAFVGVLTIVASALIGLGFRARLMRSGNRWTAPRLTLLGFLTHLVVPALIATIPEVSLETAASIAQGMLLVFVPATVVGGLLLRDSIEFLAQKEELEEVNARLRSALDGRDALMAAVSHELRTPITELYGFAETLAQDPGAIDEEERQELLRQISISGMTVSDVLRDISSVSRLTSGELGVGREVVDANQLVRDAIAMHRDWSPSVELPTTPALCWGDASRVLQILRNLVTNAVRHGGEHYSVGVTQRAEKVEICVADDGDGIPKSIEERAFEPFVSTGNPRRYPQSMGVGLWVSKELAERMGATLTYDNDGRLTRFTLALEAAEPGDASGGAAG